VSQDRLLLTMMGSYSDHLALMVKDGYLTQAQADTMSQQAKIRLQTVITSNLSSAARSQGGFGGMMRGWFGQSSQSGTSSNPGYGCGGTGGWSNQTPQSGTSSNPDYGYGTAPGYGRGMMGRW
jgi:hypothetical protein